MTEMKKLILLACLTLPVQANILQIREAQRELSSLQRSEIEHKAEFTRAKIAYERVKKARRIQEQAISKLALADRTQRLAEGSSKEFHLYESPAYEQDKGAATGGITYYGRSK